MLKSYIEELQKAESLSELSEAVCCENCPFDEEHCCANGCENTLHERLTQEHTGKDIQIVNDFVSLLDCKGDCYNCNSPFYATCKSLARRTSNCFSATDFRDIIKMFNNEVNGGMNKC